MMTPRREEEQAIEEVRRARAEVWRRAGGTAAGLVRLLSEPPPQIRRPEADKTRDEDPADDQRGRLSA
jgi:hypothetical protein